MLANGVSVEVDRKWLDLSLAQQSVWLDAKLSGASVYQLGGWARVAAPLDEDAVRQSVSLLMARHDALRLRVYEELPRQWLDDSVAPPLAVVNLQGSFEEHVEAAFASAMPFGDRPLFRIELIRAGENLSYILWRFHHLIADSASVSITLSHWFRAYEALTSGTPGDLAPPSSYLKTIASDAAYLESAAYDKDLAYWSERFDPLPPPLISDMEPRASQDARVPSAEWMLPAVDLGPSPQRALFALFALVLGRRYGQSDIVSGIALHRRDAANRHTIGMMAGIVAVRCTFDPYWTLGEAVEEFSKQLDADLRHQRLPVDILSRALGLSGTGRAGLFEVAMSFIPAEKESGIEDLPVTMGVVNTREASPISLHIHGTHVRVAVNTDFLDAAEAGTLLELFQAAVERFLRDPDTRVEELAGVSAGERARVVEEWNRTDAAFPQGTLDGLFGEQARRTPDAIAVIGRDGDSLTYAELDTASTRVARGLGIEPDEPVGVRLERSTETIVALLAILKAGGVYLPLDPAYPADRLEYMASDAGARLVLTDLDGMEGEAELPRLTNPHRRAYVIYTSGTTGLPKGVAVPHSAAVNMAFARRACHDPIGVGDRVLAAISVGFDVSIGQLLLPLLSGATVVIAGDLKTMGASEFWALLADRRVTHINSVPSFFDSILDTAPASGLHLKRLMLGGEALNGALVARIQRALPGVEVVNMYGPTEACIDATYHVAAAEEGVLPIGRPLSNYRAYVLDEMLEPVGIGVTGELYLGGSGLAHGYVNAPALTAERFVADPFASTPGARLYRTGDRARWRADGCIEFLGRVDAQVKIRGFRVEPGEIAAALLGHADVAQAVVVPYKDRLAAYFVPRAAVPDTADLRAFLARSLPDYMVPSAFVAIDAIPLNRNGKLDARALPSPDLQEGEYVEPRTPAEAMVAGLFAEVLGVDRCGATDNFFELGGHSLLATSLVSKLRTQGITVPLRAIFEAPTVEMLARRIDASVPSAKAADAIVPQVRPAEIPLSFAQERIWFVDRLQQDASYNIPVALELRGHLNLPAVERAIERIVARHESLRTRIVLRDGRPTQEILAPAPFTLRKAGPEYLTEIAAHRFDLAAAPPFEVRLIELAPDRHILATVIHHVAFDGWSAGIFFREFAALYAGETLTAPAIQYADFALWQRQQNRDADLAFWLDALEGAPATSALPADDSPEQAHPVGALPVRLPAELHASLEQFARKEGASLFMVLHAAFALLLSRWSGQDDVVVGTVVANRNRAELEDVIGCFVNTLPLRTRLQQDDSFTDLLARVKQLDLAAFAHQDLPFEQLVEAVQPERSLTQTPIFQTLLVLQNTPMPAAQLPGLAVSPVPIEPQAPQFDFTLSLGEKLEGVIEFATNRFTRATIERFAAQYQRVLEAIVADPAQQASRIDLLAPEERAQILNEWSRNDVAFPQTTLDSIFAEQVQRTPEAIAVIGADGRECTYAEIDARSTSLARYLASQGVGPDIPVGVRMPRSADSVIAILAILKAGGVYLPLDPAYPADRLAYMEANAGALLTLTSIDHAETAAELHTSQDATRLAYIIYTSGTTGQPKGVAIPHSAAVNLVHARNAGYDPLTPGDRVMAVTSVSFDVSVGQLLFPLLKGATIVIAGDVKTMGPAGFWKLVSERRVTIVNFVPSFVDSILDGIPEAGPLHLKRLLLGGEALTGAMLSRVQRMLPGLEVVNIYGPTETCIDATAHIATGADCATAILPIGRPLANYRTYILNAHMSPVGAGVTGELYIGGAGLARGYVNAPELTAERFVDDPFEPGARLYRTGDRARWRRDGCIEFLGRADAQVKIRGFRVEPGEIEAQLRNQPGVREAAVVQHDTNLIAYYTGSGAPNAEALRDGIAAILPSHMVPAAFVHLDQLPLNPNGKLDRKALPKPDQGAFVSRSFEAPVGEIEEKMAAIWAELLKLDRVGRHDNFFELGGHSLLAVTLIERMQKQGLPCDVRALFTTPTIAGLALTATTTSVAAPLVVNLTPEQRERIAASIPGGADNLQDIYPLSPLQEGILFQHLMSAQGDPYLSPVLLAFDERARLDRFLHALNAVIARHDALRTGMIWKGVDEPLQYVVRHASVPVEEVALNENELRARPYRLDVGRAPLLHAVVSRHQDRWLLLLLTHHLILDHTGLEILVHELQTLMADPEAALPPALPYRNFVEQTRVPADHEAFFREMLGTLDEPTAPFDVLEVQGDAGTVTGAFTLDPGLARRIREQARALGVTPASLFHLAWASVLGHVSGKSDVVFGTVLFGRMQSGQGAGQTVGMFINTLPIRLQLGETGAAASVLATHRLLADLLRHEHAPLSLAQRCSGVPAPAPLFSALFNYRYSPANQTRADWPGVEILFAEERTNYPLAMAVDDLGEGFQLTALAQRGIDPARVCRYLNTAISSLADALERAPETPVRALNILPRAERTQVLDEWNRTEERFPQGTLDALFAAQARKTPDAQAVDQITYAQLDDRSTALARQLGIAPGEVVGVRMERSAETVIAFLAILKAGGVYLPLDPAYPADRLAYMASDAGAKLVLDRIDHLTGDHELPQLTDPHRTAYIIYTSGTTGVPKGVAVPHSAAVNMAFARRACHDPIGPGDRILAAISVGFDVSIGQLLLPLLSGAAVVIAPDLKTLGASEFWALLADRCVTHINSVPSFFESILDAAPASGLHLKRLMLGGEALSGALVARIQRTIPGLEVVNMYGPTEACIDATYHVATPADIDAAVLPIGRPLSNYRAFVLDARLEPVAIGVTGELYLGGAGLAHGYVNAPALTAERFVADPFSYTPGARLYRTGDRARRRADGEIEFLGRMDSQVKIRGFRVEPGEIEAQLRRQPGVREAAVIADNARLIAYFTGPASVEALRENLAASLPDYMVPSAFVPLDALPLSPNGKLDRKALPAPTFEARAFEAPVGEAETKMAAIWAELLKLDRVGRHDNFFELGGHSLLAVTLIERMQQQGMTCEVRALFTTPTIAGLAQSQSTPAQDAPLIVNLTPEQRERIAASLPGGPENLQDIYPLSPLQEGMLFQHLLAPENDPYLSPFDLSFDTRAELDRFLRALDLVVQRHDVLRTAMVWKDVDEPMQVVLRQVSVPVGEGGLDLSQAPLLRAIINEDQGRWNLRLLSHHLILDHTSMEIVVHELRTLMADPHAQLPPSLPYRNFIAQTRSGPTRAEHEAFFTRLLGDVEEPTAPFGLLDTQSNSAEHGELALDATLARRIREQARALGVTPASIFHLAWAAVLAHAAAKPDPVFGTVLFGRMRSGPGADRVVGMFINTLPIRMNIDDTAAAESVRNTHRALAELLEHEHAPLALAQRCSGVPAPAPLFTSLFNYRYSDSAGDTASAERTNYPLAMAVDDSGTGFTLRALGPARVCAYLNTAVAGLIEFLEHAPNEPVNRIPVLPEAERTLVLHEWNRTDAAFPQGTLEALFQAQVERTPNGLATDLTYAELDARSTALARQLDVAPGDVVGVRMERSNDTVLAILAILKAGGVYLPLDPAYPSERLDYMAADAGAKLILTSIHGLAGDTPLPHLPDPNRTAYIIYTSGTTGNPKGVAVPHSAAVNLAFARRACHDPLGPGDRVLAAISIGFDVSIGQLLLPLLSGASIVVAPDLKTLNPAGFWHLLAEKQVTHINSVPSFFDSVLDAAPPAHTLQLKRIMLGGEALSGALVARIQRALPSVEVVNMYGPTEACIDATYHVATAEDLSSAVLPIGRPLSNYRAYILNAQREPVGIGVTGELYLGGAGLAHGYLHTSEGFLPNPFGAGRLYRTGDRARWRADGNIEFLGRIDEQVKIRGFRVEPGEIAAALRMHPAVTQAAVVPRNGRLIAYIVQSEPADLRAHLAQSLPDYMIPSAFVPIAAIPLNRNGKLDAKALPAPDASERIYEAPANAAELALQRIFETILNVHPVGRHDNFFHLGGDSLAAMRLLNAMHAAVPMRTLFEHPTVAALAAATSQQLTSTRLIPLQPNGTKPPLFCIHPAGGHVLCYLPLTRSLGPDQPVYGLQAAGLEDDEPLATSIEQAASEYIDAIKSIQPTGPYQLLGMSSGGLIAFEMARQLQDVHFLAMLDTTVPGTDAEPEFTPEFNDDTLQKALTAENLPQSVARVFRNNVRMHFAYRPEPWTGPLLVIRAQRETRVDWSPFAKRSQKVLDLDCGHSDLVSPALADTVAALIAPELIA
jgi:amino acid adenylation domain-containing protein